MDHRRLGKSDLQIPVLSFGTATFGGGDAFFRKWGSTDVAGAERLIDICLEAGVTLFDSADVYSDGAAEEILGQALGTRRGQALVATKVGYRTAPGPTGIGASRAHIVSAVEASLKRLGTDYVDILHLHGFDENTPVEETLGALQALATAGKIRYFGGSNYSGWQMMKMLAAADRLAVVRPISHQVYYSLLARDYEHELMPLGDDQGVGAVVWSPLSGGKLTGKIQRGQPTPEDSRAAKMGGVSEPRLLDIVDTLQAIAKERNKSISQVAINWLLCRPTISSVTLGARNEAQLTDNLGAAGWSLTSEEVARLSAASEMLMPYPYRHQKNFPDLLKPLA